jgi:plasmid stabilization system protein ParE
MDSSPLQVFWSPLAARDLDEVVALIRRDRPRVARDVFDRITRTAGSLRSFPERGRTLPEFEAYGITLARELIVSPWRIVYRVENPFVRVLAVLDGRRDLEELLLTRLMGA